MFLLAKHFKGRRAGAGPEAEVDVDVEMLCDSEDAGDLAVRVAVGIWTATDQVRTVVLDGTALVWTEPL